VTGFSGISLAAGSDATPLLPGPSHPDGTNKKPRPDRTGRGKAREEKGPGRRNRPVIPKIAVALACPLDNLGQRIDTAALQEVCRTAR
jgi:hypothetical protein